MQRQNCLVKISGDVLDSSTIDLIVTLSRDYFVVVCVGGGTQINEAFAKAGLPVGKFGPLGRETTTFQERQLARDVLEQNQAEIQDMFASQGVHVNVVIPVLDIGTVLCHVNGDQFALTAYHGFDVIYVVTTPDRVEDKRKFFVLYPKILVVAPPFAIVKQNGVTTQLYDATRRFTPRCPRDKMVPAVVTQAEINACEKCRGAFDKCIVPDGDRLLTKEEWRAMYGERWGR